MNDRTVVESRAVVTVEYACSHLVVEPLVNGKPRTADERDRAAHQKS